MFHVEGGVTSRPERVNDTEPRDVFWSQHSLERSYSCSPRRTSLTSQLLHIPAPPNLLGQLTRLKITCDDGVRSTLVRHRAHEVSYTRETLDSSCSCSCSTFSTSLAWTTASSHDIWNWELKKDFGRCGSSCFYICRSRSHFIQLESLLYHKL